MLINTYNHRHYPTDRVAKAKQGRRITVCIPAHNEATTIGAIVNGISAALMASVPLIDELIVVDDGSDDATASEAITAGASLIRSEGSEPGAPIGKGGAMRTGVARASGDIVVFLDADVTNFGCHFVTGLLGPLLEDPTLVMTKATYQRPCNGSPGEGGRVNTLVARPLLARCFPELAALEQPLAGEYAIRTDALHRIGLAPGYSVEVAMLIDIVRLYTADAIVQVDLGHRTHRNRPLHALSTHAAAVLAGVLDRHEAPAPCVGRHVR